MNILYINHYAGSPCYGMGYRSYYLSREWVKSGHNVLIVGASYSHLRKFQPSISGWKKDEVIDGVNFRWYKTSAYEGNGFRRLLNVFSFLFRLYNDSACLIDDFNPDLVINSSTYPMDIWPAKYIARRAGAKLVFELHDLWPLSPIEIGGMSPRHPFIMLCQAAENAIYKSVDGVVSMLPNVASYVQKKGFPLERLAIIENGFVATEWVESQQASLRSDILDALTKVKEQGKFVVGYAGSHGIPNALDNLIDAAKLLTDKPVEFFVIGDGHEKSRLQERITREGVENFHFFSPIEKNQIPGFLKMIDCAYLGAPRHRMYRFGVSPNKLFDYMMAGVPIVYAIDASNDPVKDADCGLSVQAEDPVALAGAVSSIFRAPLSERNGMGARGRAYAVANHSYDVLANKFLSSIKAFG